MTRAHGAVSGPADRASQRRSDSWDLAPRRSCRASWRPRYAPPRLDTRTGRAPRWRPIALGALLLASCSGSEPLPSAVATDPPDPDSVLVTVESPEGKPVEGALITAPVGEPLRSDANGCARISPVAAATGIWVSAPGYALASVESVAEGQVITLAPGPRLTFVLADHVELPEPPLVLCLGLAAPDGPGGAFRTSRRAGHDARGEVHDLFFAFDASRRVEVTAPAPGRYELPWAFVRRTEDGDDLDHDWLVFGQERRIDVPPDVERMSVDVEPPRAALDDARREAARTLR